MSTKIEHLTHLVASRKIERLSTSSDRATQKQKQTRGQNISGHGLARTETESKAGAKYLRKVSMTWSRVNVPPPNATKYLLRAKVLKASLFHGFYCLKYRIEMALSGVRTRRIAHQALIVFEV